jgi:hypothetical protein
MLLEGRLGGGEVGRWGSGEVAAGNSKRARAGPQRVENAEGSSREAPTAAGATWQFYFYFLSSIALNSDAGPERPPR